jgi:hypothetical protein
MSSEVEICNNSLLQLGEDPITSLDDATRKANLCKAFYPKVRDATLRAYPWRCAIAFQDLGLMAGVDAIPTTATPFSYTYQLPVNPWCLRALLVNADRTLAWEVVGRKLLCDESTVNLRYIYRVTDPGRYDPLLEDAISCRLASMLAYPITASPTMSKTLYELYLTKLVEARSIDSMEGSNEDYESVDLLEVR